MTAEEGMTVEAVTKEETEIEISQIIEAGTTVEVVMTIGAVTTETPEEVVMTIGAVTTEILEEVVMTAEERMTVEAVTTEILEEILIRAMTGLVANVAM